VAIWHLGVYLVICFRETALVLGLTCEKCQRVVWGWVVTCVALPWISVGKSTRRLSVCL